MKLEDLSHKGSACSLETSGQADRKVVNISPIIGFNSNLRGSSESVGNSDILNKSPTMNRTSVSQTQDEWQKKLYKNKGKIFFENSFSSKVYWEIYTININIFRY